MNGDRCTSSRVLSTTRTMGLVLAVLALAVACGGGSTKDVRAGGNSVTLGQGGFTVPGGSTSTPPSSQPAPTSPGAPAGGAQPAPGMAAVPGTPPGADGPGGVDADPSFPSDDTPLDPPPPPTPAQAAIADLLITTVPAGYVVQPEEDSDSGPIDLEKAVDDDGADDARAFFTSHGFVAGYERLWYKDDNYDRAITDGLYRFQAPSGAQAYLQRTLDQLTAASAHAGPVQKFDVNSIPGALGYRATADGVHFAAVVFAKGSFFAGVIVSDDGPADLVPVVTGLARQQFDRLP